jgi:hypothetical protein
MNTPVPSPPGTAVPAQALPPPRRYRIRTVLLAGLVAVMVIVITVLTTLLSSRPTATTPAAAPAGPGVDTVLDADRHTCAAYDRSQAPIKDAHAAIDKIPNGLAADSPAVRNSPEYMDYINTFADKLDEAADILAAGLDKNSDMTMIRIVRQLVDATRATATAYRAGRPNFSDTYQAGYHADLAVAAGCKA